jgi:hypothetical protein
MLPGQRDHLWRNRGDGTFEDVTTPSGLYQPDGKGMSAVFADLDGDGRLDLYVTNDGQANSLFRNRGRGVYRDEAFEAGAALDRFGAPEGSMGVEVGDIDRDGRLDLVYSNFRHEGTRALRGIDSRGYLDVSINSRLMHLTEPYVGWGLALADFDGDGWLDLFQANGHVYPNTPDSHYDQPPLFLRSRGGAGPEFEDVTASWGPELDGLRSGRSVAAGDIDGDGDLDLVMTTIDGPLRLLVNEGMRSSRAVIVRLAGAPPNREALGARVELWTGGQAQTAVVRRGGGFLAASDASLHFGLGRAGSVKRVVVRWPDGSSSEHTGLPADALLVIRQGDQNVSARPFLTTEPDPGSEP